MNNSVSVMLVDDSLVIRGALKRLLQADNAIDVVATAADGERALAKISELKPDVVILDIEMPVMDGLTALPKILKASPDTKVIMFSSLTEKGASVTMKALSLGATECLVKPSTDQDVGPGSEFEQNLIRTVKTIGTLARTARQPLASGTAAAKPQKTYELNKNPATFHGAPSLLAIGSSTGGPNACFEVSQSFKNFPIPIIITQHMPAKFTTIFAQHIQQKTGIPAQEGETGMVLENGKIYVAPGGFHMLLKKDGAQTVIQLDEGPPVNFCKPAVDPMIKSAVEIYGSRVLGVILTGMGNDGLGGGRDIVKAGGRIIAQNEETSTVWGMPRAVAEAGICSEILPLEEIGPWVRKQVLGHA
jgi:two-component system chemotaxis response regulator CheB